MIGSQFVCKTTLSLSFVVISAVDGDNFLVMNYTKIRDHYGLSVRVLTGAEIISKSMINKDYIKFDSPEFHQAMKELEKSAFA